jgi:hypothetical protein
MNRGCCFEGDWLNRFFLVELIQTATSNKFLRIGALRVVVSVAESIPAKAFYGHLVLLFKWASESVEIGIALLSEADAIMTPKTIHLFPDFRELLAKICQAPDFDLKIRLPAIVSSNPTVFLGNAANLRPVLAMLAADRSSEMRAALLEHFSTIFTKAAIAELQEALFAMFVQSFEDLGLRSRLLECGVYPFLGYSRMARVAPLFLDLVQAIAYSRDMQNAMAAYLTFPPDIILSSWQGIVPIVFRFVADSPFVMRACCETFCEKISRVLDAESGLVDLVIGNFFRHDRFSARQIASSLAAAMAVRGQPPEIVGQLFMAMVELARDPVVSVQASVLPALVAFKLYYSELEDKHAERQTVALYMSFSRLTDPLIEQKWSENAYIFSKMLRNSRQKATTASVGLLQVGDKLPELASPRLLEAEQSTGKRVVRTPVIPRLQAAKRIVRPPSISESPSPARGMWPLVPGVLARRRTVT